MRDIDMRRNECPLKNKHTKSPDRYVSWHEWAEKKERTHRQIKCKGCGLYEIWVKKTPKVAIKIKEE